MTASLLGVSMPGAPAATRSAVDGTGVDRIDFDRINVDQINFKLTGVDPISVDRAGADWSALGWVVVATVVAAVVTLVVGRWLIRRSSRLGLDDEPNHRSSHTRVTPGGGGLAFVVGTVVATLLLGATGVIAATPTPWLLAIAGCLGLAVVGLLDDLHSLGQWFRLGCQGIAVVLIIMAGLGEATRHGLALPWPTAASTAIGWIGLVGIALAGVWWINLFNFMDGIDGLATAEALFLLIAASIVMVLSPAAPALAPPFDLIDCSTVLLIAALLGFVPLNRPPARVFMGDVGSLFLGVSIFLVAMHGVTSGRISAWFWPIAAGAFISDATVTLARRLLSGQNVFSAHRSHLYQRLSQRWSDHGRVTLVYCAINISWFLPLALLADFHPRFGGVLLVVAYLPALLLLWRAGAGLADIDSPEPSAGALAASGLPTPIDIDAQDASTPGAGPSRQGRSSTERT